MRLTVKVLLALVILLAAPSVFAQLAGDGSDTYSVAAISDGCGDTMNADECMFGSDSSSMICKKAYCPSCGLNQTQTASVCYTLQGNYGYCSCQPGGVTIDKYGNKWPNCNASGSCTPPD